MSEARAAIRQNNFSSNVQGKVTSFLVQLYADYVFIIISQTGTVGTLLRARANSSLGGHSSFSVDLLFGRRNEPWHDVCARQLVQQVVDLGFDRPLLLSLALFTVEAAVIRQVVHEVKQALAVMMQNGLSSAAR